MAHQTQTTTKPRKHPTDAEIREAENDDKWDNKSITNSYYRIRVDELPELMQTLKENDKEKLKFDAERIQRLRKRLSNSVNSSHLLHNVPESFKEWRDEAVEKRNVKFQRCSVPRADQLVKTLDFVEDIIDTTEDAEDDKNTAVDFIASILFFEKDGTGWKKANYHGHGFDNSETFPNQKMTVHKALFDKDHNPFAQTKDHQGRRHLKYIHLPANHMEWVEQAIARHYGEDSEPIPGNRKMTDYTLSREFWRGQVHGAGLEKHPVHARHLRTRCLSIPHYGDLGATTSQVKRKSFAIFLPYLHWEMHGRATRMAAIVQEAVSANRKTPNAGAMVEHSKDDEIMDLKETLRETLKKHVHSNDLERTAVRKLRFEKKTKLGIYLMNVARLWEAMDTEADKSLIRHGLVPHPEAPLHIRRTLDQSYFLNLKDTSHRDRDQVVYRATKLPWYAPGNLRRVVMVDQLWMWMLDDYTIITAFPRRWGRNKPDSSGIHKSLRDRLDRMKGQVTSVWNLASIIIDQCSRVFFDRTRPLDLRPEVLDLFVEALNNVNEYTTIASQAFWAQAERGEQGRNQDSLYLKINPEGILLREAQDIDEELRMMIRIYSQQLAAVEDFHQSLQHWNKQLSQLKNDGGDLETSSGEIPAPISSTDFDFIEEMKAHIKSRKGEIEELANAADRSCYELQGLLTLKQQQASIVEANMSYKLGKQSYEQGKSIMAFTIMTIIFTPLGFFTSFFGMNNSATGQAWMSLWEQIVTMLVISAVIIFIFLAIAFKRSLFMRSLWHRVKTAKRTPADDSAQGLTSGPEVPDKSNHNPQSQKVPTVRPSGNSNTRRWRQAYGSLLRPRKPLQHPSHP